MFFNNIKYSFIAQPNKLLLMNKQIQSLLVLVCLLVFGVSNAQQDAQFSQYMFNNMYNNPGYAGLEDNPTFTAIHRSQWVGYEGGNPPQGQILTASLPVRLLKGGLGLQFENDQLGAYRKVDFLLSYSYHINIGDGKLGLGIRSGLVNTSVNGRYKPTDPNDQTVSLLDKNANEFSPDYALGVFYNHSVFNFGASLNHFVKQQLNNLNTQQSRHINVTGGYNYQFASNVVLTPSFIVKYDEGNASGSGQWSSDVSLRATFNAKYWLGFSYRKNDAIIPFVGINMLKNNALKLGFAYDYTIVNQSAKSSSSYEILLTYSLPAIANLIKPIIRSPRYRFE